ncbi:hypothetical protein EKK58_09205 [Candidatus Dependentiae bacterium]|nr:MAG: hypothetical protein EKK58_09205 [Candidatus Dependentiae bacterium]
MHKDDVKRLIGQCRELIDAVYEGDPQTISDRALSLQSFLDARNKTKVIFRKFKQGGDIIAFFPELPGTNSPNTCMNYMHIGQHGHGDANCGHTIPAKRAEYMPLLKELRSIGYNLEIVNKFAPAHRAKRVAELDRKYKA